MPSAINVKAAFSLIENDKSKVLSLTVGTHQNVQPGDYIPRAGKHLDRTTYGVPPVRIFADQHHTDAQSPPELSFPGASPDKTYFVVGLDIDAPFPSFDVLGPILHWIQPGVKVTESSGLDISGPFVANYIGPAPPPGSSPHRYIFFLYEEPAGFDLKKYAPVDGKPLGNWHRMRYDFDSWAKEINLGPLVAFNYFTSN